MTWQGWLQIAVFAALVTAVVKPLGGYIMRNVDGGGKVQRAFAPFERGLYRLAGVNPAEDQGWVDYAMALLCFHLVGIVVLYALLRLQQLLPLNPRQFDAMTPDLALNTNTFGRMVGDQRHGWALFAVMAILFVAGLAAIYGSEAQPNGALASFHLDQSAGNMEGKEVRFGVSQSSLWSTAATASSDGAVDAMHDSFMPLSSLVLMANMMVDEVIVGGPGSGLFGVLLFAIVAVFAAGLMIGRTPEYLGKKIESSEVKMTMLALLCPPAAILGISAVACVLPIGLAGLNNAGPHGFSEILYVYTSAAATNGSAFAGLSANTPFYNLTLAVAMFAGRFLVIVPVLCIAGTLAAKRIVPASAGTLPTHGMQFVGLMVGTIVIVGGLTFFPALALGPAAEHFAPQAGQTY